MGEKNSYTFIFFGVLLLLTAPVRLSAMNPFMCCCSAVDADDSDPNRWNLGALLNFECIVIQKGKVFIGYREVEDTLKKLNDVLKESPEALVALARVCNGEETKIPDYAHCALIDGGLIDWFTGEPTPKTVHIVKAAVILWSSMDETQLYGVEIRSDVRLYMHLQNPPCLITASQAKKLMSQEEFQLMMYPSKKIEHRPINPQNPFAHACLTENVAGKILEFSKK